MVHAAPDDPCAVDPGISPSAAGTGSLYIGIACMAGGIVLGAISGMACKPAKIQSPAAPPAAPMVQDYGVLRAPPSQEPGAMSDDIVPKEYWAVPVLCVAAGAAVAAAGAYICKHALRVHVSSHSLFSCMRLKWCTQQLCFRRASFRKPPLRSTCRLSVSMPTRALPGSLLWLE